MSIPRQKRGRRQISAAIHGRHGQHDWPHTKIVAQLRAMIATADTPQAHTKTRVENDSSRSDCNVPYRGGVLHNEKTAMAKGPGSGSGGAGGGTGGEYLPPDKDIRDTENRQNEKIDASLLDFNPIEHLRPQIIPLHELIVLFIETISEDTDPAWLGNDAGSSYRQLGFSQVLRLQLAYTCATHFDPGLTKDENGNPVRNRDAQRCRIIREFEKAGVDKIRPSQILGDSLQWLSRISEYDNQADVYHFGRDFSDELTKRIVRSIKAKIQHHEHEASRAFEKAQDLRRTIGLGPLAALPSLQKDIDNYCLGCDEELRVLAKQHPPLRRQLGEIDEQICIACNLKKRAGLMKERLQKITSFIRSFFTILCRNDAKGLATDSVVLGRHEWQKILRQVLELEDDIPWVRHFRKIWIKLAKNTQTRRFKALRVLFNRLSSGSLKDE